MNRKFLVPVIAFSIATVSLTGCSLFPSEDNSSHVIEVATEASYDYELEAALIGDVTLSKTVYFTYTQLKDATLSFDTGSLSVRYVYVSEGDSVREGDLLAKLDTTSLEADYENYSYSVETTKLRIDQTRALWDYDLKALEKRYRNEELDKDYYEAERESINHSYESAIKNYEDSLYISDLRLAQINEKLAGSSIYAPMDGTVSYIKDSLKDSYATSGEAVMTIIDTTNCAFALDDREYADYFEPDVEYTFTVGKDATYTVTKMDYTESDTVYLALTDPSQNVQVGAHAKCELTIDTKPQVLMIPNTTLHKAGEYTYVYVEDENGIKSLRYVTTGLVGTTHTEILDGLSEGDAVIRK